MIEPATEALEGTAIALGDREIHCVVAGDESARPIIFVHGIPTSSYLWRNVQRPLSERYRTVALDLVGLGQSSRPPLPLVDQADVIAELADHLGIDRFVLVAHDIGGGVASHFMAKHGDRVDALAVMNVVAFAASWPVLSVKLMRAPVLGAISGLVPAGPLLRRELRRGVYHRERMSGAVLEAYSRPILGLANQRNFVRFIRGMDPAAVERDLRADADRDIPRLVLWGEADRFQPIRWGEQLSELWGVPLQPIAEAGHFLQEDQPGAIAQALDRFIAAV